jgi:hypothetical protein
MSLSKIKKCKHCDVKLCDVYHEGYQCKTCKNGISRYGLNRNQQKTILNEQNSKCKLCGCSVKLFVGNPKFGVVDHCHKTGKVRGILCGSCNNLIGNIENSKNIDVKNFLKKICNYLK